MKYFIFLFVPGLFFWGAYATAEMPGRFSDVPVMDKTVIDAALFAVESKAKKLKNDRKSAPVHMKLHKILSAQQQVVSGMNYQLTLEVNMDGVKKVAEAIVWWQAWREPNPYILTSWLWEENKQMK